MELEGAGQPYFSPMSQKISKPLKLPYKASLVLIYLLDTGSTTPVESSKGLTPSKDSRISKYTYLPNRFMKQNGHMKEIKLPSRDSTIDAYFVKKLEMAPPPSSSVHSSNAVSDMSKYDNSLQPHLQKIYRKNKKYQYI